MMAWEHFKIRLRNLMHSGKPTHKEANDMGKNELSNFKGRVMKAKGLTAVVHLSVNK